MTERPIRVLLIGPSMAITGGQSVMIRQVLEHVGARPEVDIRFQWMNFAVPFPVNRVPGLRTLVAWLAYLPILIVRAPRYDVIHAFTAAYWGYYLWVLPALGAARLFGKKFILHYHDGQAKQHLDGWRWARPTIKRVDALIVPSGFLVDVFAAYGIRAHVIFNVVDTDRFRFRQRSAISPRLLHNRGHEPLYNVPCALRAFQRIQATWPNAELTVAHDGPERANLEALARTLGLRNCHFVGRVKYEDGPAVYDAADIYLTTPNIDNMPVSLLEASASGLPIVATRAGGIPWIVTDGESALLVPLDDDAAAAEACLRLLGEPALVERLTTNARAALRPYAGATVAQEWVRVYREVLAGDALRP
ncbi:MAG: glycosyltransferase family 4 protein [Gemmatimonadaceae bacterium]|nr:glycosyltransferase family 4 protein [Gemmatimonadaceae bacterium]